VNVGATLSAAGLSVLVFGFSNVSSAFGPLPLDLTAFGMPGCYARVARAVARVDPRRNACRPLGVADAEGTLAIGSLPPRPVRGASCGTGTTARFAAAVLTAAGDAWLPDLVVPAARR
jgi:hypothetical protein